jgi:hypothetical protein
MTPGDGGVDYLIPSPSWVILKGVIYELFY